MITYVATDLFQSPAQVLVNTVNTVGVMGKGIAKEFKRIYPEMFAQYQKLCERAQFQTGQLWLYKTPHKWILNFPTKKHWRLPSRPEYIQAGLEKFVQTYAELGITSISFPLLGCGNGELNWEKTVRPIMTKYLQDLPIVTFMHLYQRDPFAPEHRDAEAIKTWLKSEPEALGFIEVWEDLTQLLQNRNDFYTLDDNTMFEIKLVKEPEAGILIENYEAPIFVPQETLLDSWQHIRGFGFCMEETLPAGLDKYARYIVALMSKLPYLKPVLMGRDHKKINRNNIGLQLIPRLHRSPTQRRAEQLQLV